MSEINSSDSIIIDYRYDRYTQYGILLLLEYIESKIRITDNPVIILFAGEWLYKQLQSDYGDTITLNNHVYPIVFDINFPDGELYFLTIFKDKEIVNDLDNACLIMTYSFETGAPLGIRVNNPELQAKIINIGEI